MARSLSSIAFVALAAIGCSGSGNVSLGKDGDGLSACAASDCGPAPGVPTTTCADGTTGGFTGRCVEAAGSTTCGWEIKTCSGSGGGDCTPPPPTVCPDGTVTVAGCSKDPSGGCTCAGTTCPTEVDGGIGEASADAIVVDATSTCFDPTGTVPSYMRSCKTLSDCAVGKHQTDCCGSIVYTGIASSELSAFDACETPWDAHFPGCGCAGRWSADDGKMISDPTKIGVYCIVPSGSTEGTCETTSCAAGQTCSAGATCSTGCGGIDCTCNSSGVYECRPNLC